MSNERKPLRRDYVQREYDRPLLVSDRDLYQYTVTENGMAGENKNRMLRRLRHFYENLIATGKLRIVEEVELDFYFQCKKCGSAKSYEDSYSGTMEDEGNPFCKGCGNKIKR